MKKISFVVIVLFMFMVWTPVEAKEYNISELYYEIGFNNNQIFEIESGDVIVKGDDRYIFFDLFVYNPSNELIEGYRHPNMPDRYVVKSCQEIIGGEIPRGKKCIINLNAFVGSTSATNAYNHINYLLVDDIQKEIIYNNTYDVENSNPTTYYVEETNILLNDIERDGYRFLGWYSSPTFEEDTRVTMISDAEPEVLELYAKWEKIEEVVDSNEDNIFVNPETNSLIYIGIGIAFILVFANILVIVYKYRK